jgi:hypothetical protein
MKTTLNLKPLDIIELTNEVLCTINYHSAYTQIGTQLVTLPIGYLLRCNSAFYEYIDELGFTSADIEQSAQLDFTFPVPDEIKSEYKGKSITIKTSDLINRFVIKEKINLENLNLKHGISAQIIASVLWHENISILPDQIQSKINHLPEFVLEQKRLIHEEAVSTYSDAMNSLIFEVAKALDIKVD